MIMWLGQEVSTRPSLRPGGFERCSGRLPQLQQAVHRRIVDEQERAASPLRLDSKLWKAFKIGPEVGPLLGALGAKGGAALLGFGPGVLTILALGLGVSWHLQATLGWSVRLFRVTPFLSLVPKHRKQAPRPQFSLVATPFITGNHQEGASCLLNRSWLKAVRGPEGLTRGVSGTGRQ